MIEIPCGRCGCGLYDIAAMQTPLARKLAALPEADRASAVPRCKRFERPCVGARDFCDALVLNPKMLDEAVEP